MKLIKARKEDRSSPNGVIGTVLLALFFICILCGKTIWVPASRVENLYVRSILLSVSDAVSAFSSATGLDGLLPEFRSRFISATGLSSHVEWDTRYYNSRSDQSSPALAKAKSSGAVSSADSAAVSKTALDGRSTGVSLPGTENSRNVDALSTVSSGNSQYGTASAAIHPRNLLPPVLADIRGGPAGSYETRDSVFLEVAGISLGSRAPTSPARKSFSGLAGYIHSAENPLRVYMFGDSQVFSLGAGLSRLAGKDSPIAIDSLPIHSSGFIRADYYNWPAKLEDTFSSGSYEAAVMMLGMNDYQSFRDEQGVILRKHTPEWEAAYKEKCRAIIDIVLASVPRLYWIGMPVVRNGVYNQSLAYINSVQDSLVAEYSPDVLVRFSLRDSFPGKGKPYQDSIEPVNGKMIRVMSDDGSHFTVEGGQYAMKPLFDRFGKDYLFTSVPVAHLPE